jgi:large subunit ribosomal protein L20
MISLESRHPASGSCSRTNQPPGDQPWLASNVASPVTPSTRKSSRPVEKANQYAFRDRKRKKRTFRALWIQRLNAAVRPFGLSYSRFIDGLAKAGVMVDRKVLSDLAIHEPTVFESIVERAKAALPATATAA